VSAVEIPAAKKSAPSRKTGLEKLISVEGQADSDFVFAKCCHPIKGEEIIGYMTKNRGLVIHRKNCPNVNLEIPSRLKQVSWNDAPKHAYQVKLQLLAADKPGMLSTITGITAASESNIKKIELEQASQAMVRISLIFEVADMFQLNEIIGRVKALPGVYSLNRRKLAEK
jgi:GTP pyrophosphokinase